MLTGNVLGITFISCIMAIILFVALLRKTWILFFLQGVLLSIAGIIFSLLAIIFLGFGKLHLVTLLMSGLAGIVFYGYCNVELLKYRVEKMSKGSGIF